MSMYTDMRCDNCDSDSVKEVSPGVGHCTECGEWLSADDLYAPPPVNKVRKFRTNQKYDER